MPVPPRYSVPRLDLSRVYCPPAVVQEAWSCDDDDRPPEAYTDGDDGDGMWQAASTSAAWVRVIHVRPPAAAFH